MRSETYNALSTTFWLDTTPHAADLTLPCAGSAGTTNITNVSISMSSSILTSFPSPCHFTFSLPPKLAILTSALIANLCCSLPFTLAFFFPLFSTGSVWMIICVLRWRILQYVLEASYSICGLLASIHRVSAWVCKLYLHSPVLWSLPVVPCIFPLQALYVCQFDIHCLDFPIEKCCMCK